MGEIGRPSWNSRWRSSDTINNDAIRFTVIENMDIAVEIMILSIIDFKLSRKNCQSGGHFEKRPPSCLEVQSPVAPHLKILVFTYTICVQRDLLLSQNAQFTPKSPGLNMHKASKQNFGSNKEMRGI